MKGTSQARTPCFIKTLTWRVSPTPESQPRFGLGLDCSGSPKGLSLLPSWNLMTVSWSRSELCSEVILKLRTRPAWVEVSRPSLELSVVSSTAAGREVGSPKQGLAAGGSLRAQETCQISTETSWLWWGPWSGSPHEYDQTWLDTIEISSNFETSAACGDEVMHAICHF